MGLESVTKISDLNELWPLGTDERRYGDDHLRAIKVAVRSLLTNTNQLAALDLDLTSNDATTGDASRDGELVLRNSNATVNAFTLIQHDSPTGTVAAGLQFTNVDPTSHYARVDLFTRGAGGFRRAFTALDGKVGIGGITALTAWLHLAAGTAAANTAPLKLASGTNLTTPEAGAFEFDGTSLYFTLASTRKAVSFTDTAPAAHVSSHNYGGSDAIPRYSARVSKGSWSVPNSGWQSVSWTTEEYDFGACYAAGNPTRLVAPVDGIYLLTGEISVQSQTAEYEVGVQFKLNGTTTKGAEGDQVFADGTYRRMNFSTVVSLSAADYLEMQVSQTHTGSVNSSGSIATITRIA